MTQTFSSASTEDQRSNGGNKLASNTVPRWWIARLWVHTYHSIPKVYIPGTQLEISIVLASATVLTSARLLAEYLILELLFDWPRDSVATKYAAACLGGILHSLTLIPALIVLLSTQRYAPSERLAVAPLWWQQMTNSALQFCTGYMIYDGLVNIILLRWQPGKLLPELNASDMSFLFHHFATSFYMTTARVIQAGHMSAMMCMLIGEITNPLHNSYLLAEEALKLTCCNGSLSKQIHSMIELLFASSYCFVRVFVGPVACLHMTYDILVSKQGRANIPLPLRIVWNLMIWAVVLGSIPWITECYGMLQKHLTLIIKNENNEL